MSSPKVRLLDKYEPDMKEILRISSDEEVPIATIVENDYSSVLEHIAYTFEVECSIAAARELLEHRMASHTGRSTRYCDESEAEVILPPEIHDPEKHFVEQACKRAVNTYKELISRGVRKEFARYVLPLAIRTRYIWTINARSLINFLGLRLCVRAAPEMREIAHQVLRLVRKENPEIFYRVYCRGMNYGLCPENNMRPDKCPFKRLINTKEEGYTPKIRR